MTYFVPLQEIHTAKKHVFNIRRQKNWIYVLIHQHLKKVLLVLTYIFFLERFSLLTPHFMVYIWVAKYTFGFLFTLIPHPSPVSTSNIWVTTLQFFQSSKPVRWERKGRKLKRMEKALFFHFARFYHHFFFQMRNSKLNKATWTQERTLEQPCILRCNNNM